MAYAIQTKVPIDQSRSEIEKILSKYGGTAFGFMNKDNRSIILFEIYNKRVRFELPWKLHIEVKIIHLITHLFLVKKLSNVQNVEQLNHE